MKNPYTQEKIQSIYNGIPDAKLSKNKKNYIIWGIICIVLIHPIFLATGAFLLWRAYLISKEIARRAATNTHIPATASAAPAPSLEIEKADPPHYSFSDGAKIYLSDVDINNFDVIKTYHTKVVGVSFENDDGTDRQLNIEYARPLDALIFREFEYEGKTSYAVHLDDGCQIGNLKELLAGDISDFMEAHEKELFMYGQISEITGGDDGMKYGCNITIYLLARK